MRRGGPSDDCPVLLLFPITPFTKPNFRMPDYPFTNRIVATFKRTLLVCCALVLLLIANARHPSDANRPLRDIQTSVPGGSYAVREVIELILKAKGVWPVILAKYEAS